MNSHKGNWNQKWKIGFLSLVTAAAFCIYSAQASAADKKVKYWANPMNPAIHSDHFMKDDMNMDYIPVYEEETSSDAGAPPSVQGLSSIHLSPYKEQLIDVKFATVQKSPVVRTIRTVGQFGGGDGDFADMAADFSAQKPLHTSNRYVVADIYALDFPFVKKGQEAWVTPLSGGGSPVKGKVVSFYPYDQTQSRVVRAKIQLTQADPSEIYANVEITASTSPRLSLPATAVMDTGSHQYVFVVTALGVYLPTLITVGFVGDDLLEVTSGLKEGDKVVDGALFMIDADSKINAAFSDTK